MSSSNQFDASGSLAGYLFQCRLALLIGLQLVKKSANGHISIEKFDDIAFEDANYSKCLYQAKHHINAKSVSDSSVDVWKTFRIWIDEFTNNTAASSGTRRILITTAIAPDDGAMAKLRAGSTKENRTAAASLLKIAASKSKNQTSLPGRKAFLALTDPELEVFLASITVIDGHANLSDVMTEIEGELILVSPSHASKVAEALEGWWLSVIGKHLIGEGNSLIPLQNIVKKAHEIGSLYGPDGLPIHDPSELNIKEYSEDDEAQIFVRQMRSIKLPETAIRRGVQDFYRSTSQRSKWARESLLLDGETARYDANLKDRWARKFEEGCTSISKSEEHEKATVGRKVYFWATQEQISFRNVVETWITAGSFHALSDRLEIGWHPDYETQFQDEEQ